jgi:hypothetical protein
MLLVIVMAAALWGIGAVMGAPRRLRWSMIGGLWLAVVALHLVLPPLHPLRLATGESAAPWLLIGGFAVIVAAYRWGLDKLRARARQAGTPAAQGLFSEAELDRYARHIVLREVGGPGQKKLKEARVLVIGAGGLGAPVLTYQVLIGTLGSDDLNRFLKGTGTSRNSAQNTRLSSSGLNLCCLSPSKISNVSTRCLPWRTRSGGLYDRIWDVRIWV